MTAAQLLLTVRSRRLARPPMFASPHLIDALSVSFFVATVPLVVFAIGGFAGRRHCVIVRRGTRRESLMGRGMQIITPSRILLCSPPHSAMTSEEATGDTNDAQPASTRTVRTSLKSSRDRKSVSLLQTKLPPHSSGLPRGKIFVIDGRNASLQCVVVAATAASATAFKRIESAQYPP